MDIILPIRIKQIRKEHGYKSQQDLADALSVDRSLVKGWENEKKPVLPRLDNLLSMCDLFQCDLDYLTGRIQEPTHDIKYFKEITGLSVEAIKKLISLKGTGIDGILSEIIDHKNSDRFFHALVLSTDEDEIAWRNLDEIPRNLLSSYAEKPIDFSVGVGADIADFIASQELTSIIRNVRETHEKGKEERRKKEGLTDWRLAVSKQYRVYAEKQTRNEMLERLEDDYNDLHTMLYEDRPAEEEKRIEKMLKKIDALTAKISNATFMEWNQGIIQKEFEDMYGNE